MPPLGGFSEEEYKAIIKEAINEWLDSKFLLFGKWSLKGIVAMIIAATAYFFPASRGWAPPR